jgi:DNA-binding NarL/FixJ family response regulator
VTTSEPVERGRAAFERSAWTVAYDQLSLADRESGLEPEDVERLATVAFLIGREEESSALWARAHSAYLARGETEQAAGCAYWLGFGLVNRGEFARAGGWIARAAKLLDEVDHDCVQRGYLVMLAGIQALWNGDLETSMASAQQAAELAARFGDADLQVLSGLARGQILITGGSTAEGMSCLDEVMVAVTAGEASPTVAGLAYCAVISACQDVFDLHRAREWSSALTYWCDDQPDLVPYSGWCLVHRGEIMELHGAWADAAETAERAFQRSLLSSDSAAGGAAHYILADLHRLRGDFTQAEEGYREASRLGREPQPGLALLRVAQGRAESAASTIRRRVDETQGHLARARVLPAYVEIMLEVADVAAAGSGADELAAIASATDSALLRAASAHCAGAVLLSEHEPRAALTQLRRAWTGWRNLDVPYEAARVRVLIGLACRALADEDAAQMEMDAARWAFLQLGATCDLARVEAALARPDAEGATCGLTARELEVLRLVAAGSTNRGIATDLFLSEKTVARHVSNIFSKLDVPSRAAATAFAYEHDLV